MYAELFDVEGVQSIQQYLRMFEKKYMNNNNNNKAVDIDDLLLKFLSISNSVGDANYCAKE